MTSAGILTTTTRTGRIVTLFSPQALQTTAVVEEVRPLAKQTWAIKLQQPELASRITPGQFFMVRPAEGSDPLLGRPFALYDTYDDSVGNVAGVEFGFVEVGKLTTLMTNWKVGQEVEVWGPLGNGFPAPTEPNLICVAGGIGQTPFLGVANEALGHRRYGSPARKLAQKPQSVSLLYGVRSVDYLAGKDDFTIDGLNFQYATDDGSTGHSGYVTELLDQQLAKQSQQTEVYCCGPEPMMKAVAKICEQHSVSCWLSMETPMACGFGACFSCVAKVRDENGEWDYQRTCIEGPVFKAEQLIL